MARITIKAQNLAYFQALQSQMECSNPTEALNHLLMDLKRRGYSFLDGMEYIPQAIATENSMKTVVKKIRQKLAQQESKEAEFVEPSAEIDPIIQRMATLLEDF